MVRRVAAVNLATLVEVVRSVSFCSGCCRLCSFFCVTLATLVEVVRSLSFFFVWLLGRIVRAYCVRVCL